MFKTVSFSLIGWRHVGELSKYFNVYSIDEDALPRLYVNSQPIVILHPYFYPIQKFGDMLLSKRFRFKRIIGVDVADSNRISNYAVELTSYADAMIVPSNYACKSYVDSGVRVPVHVIPHALDDKYYTQPKTYSEKFNVIKGLKSKGYITLLTYCIHSPYRKGLDLAFKIHAKLLGEKLKVALIVKTAMGLALYLKPTHVANGVIEKYADMFINCGWLSDDDKISLYDLCDIYLLTSRGGGFELNGLEALARGCITIAGRGGSWSEYMPPQLLVSSKPSGVVLEGNPIHVGTGVELDVDEACNLIYEIVCERERYSEIVGGHVNRIRNVYSWVNVGLKLKSIVEKYV